MTHKIDSLPSSPLPRSGGGTRQGVPFLLSSLVLFAACGGTTATPKAPAPVPAPNATPEAAPVSAPITTAAPQELVFPEEPFRAEQPAPTAPRPFQLPAMKTFKLDNGIQAYLVEKHDLPVVSIDLVFDGGSAWDPPGKDGLASVCMSMMSEGTQKLDKLAFAEALADVASQVSSFAGSDQQGVSMSSLSKHWETTFGLFVDTLLAPGFRADELDRMIKRRLEALKQAKGAPASIASRVSNPVFYGPGHPLGHVVTEKSLTAITIDDCKQYHARSIKPGGARLFVVGDMTEDKIRTAFGEPLAAWKGKLPKAKKIALPRSMKGRIFFVDVPGAAQSEVYAMHGGPKRTAPDYFATSVLSGVFGGSFASRINMNLREGKGYSYGARGTFGYQRDFGTFTAAASVRSDSTYQTLLEISGEIERLASGKAPPLDAEVTREKEGAILGLPARFATGAGSLGMYRSLIYYGLPLDYYGSYTDKVGAVTTADVTKAAKHLKPKDAVYIVVGDGAAPMIVRNGDKDEPFLKEGKPVTLRDALAQLVAEKRLGAGVLVELDTDGVAKKK